MKYLLSFALLFAAAPAFADPCCEVPEDTYCHDCGPICGGYVDFIDFDSDEEPIVCVDDLDPDCAPGAAPQSFDQQDPRCGE